MLSSFISAIQDDCKGQFYWIFILGSKSSDQKLSHKLEYKYCKLLLHLNFFESCVKNNVTQKPVLY